MRTIYRDPQADAAAIARGRAKRKADDKKRAMANDDYRPSTLARNVYGGTGRIRQPATPPVTGPVTKLLRSNVSRALATALNQKRLGHDAQAAEAARSLVVQLRRARVL